MSSGSYSKSSKVGLSLADDAATGGQDLDPVLNDDHTTNDIITGGPGNDLLTGTAGDDFIDGGLGNDFMQGLTGNDVYVADSNFDAVSEQANAGTDTVMASCTYALDPNVENLTLTGSGDFEGYGNSLANTLNGNSSNNLLNGRDGNDTLDGAGGADTMIGGTGNDTYAVDNAGDVVTENANEGTDTVNASVTYTLSANVENLTLTGSGNIDGTGNNLNNVILGNSGNNTMTGGLGNDTYFVDNAGDVVTENANQGTDTVNASVTYTLSANVENLTLTGSGNIDGTGNNLNNVILGNSGNNTMTGGLGNDTYFVDNAGDVVTEKVPVEKGQEET